MQFDIEVNGQVISAKRGETIKNVLDRNGIRVPTLCFMDGFTPTGGCRMCVVEVDGIRELVPSCSHPVTEWMKIKTHTPRVLKARRTLVELLLASHQDDCLYCERSGNCGLQSLAIEMNVRERKYHGTKQPFQIDHTCDSITRDPGKCILCGRCIRVCDEIIGVSAIDVIGRGSSSRIGTSHNKGLNTQACIRCGQCIMVCPTGALTEKSSLQQVVEALNNPGLYPVIQFSPTVPVSIGEDFNLRTSKDILNILRAALRKMGFRQVFDTSMAADITLMEEASEFAERFTRQENLPMITSCCPGWTRYVAGLRPGLLPYLSTVYSPQQIMGRIIKNYITSSAGQKPENVFVVSVMPCTAKKHEAAEDRKREGEVKYVDAVLTTRELVRLIRLLGIDFNNVEPDVGDNHYSISSSSGKLFGVGGGHLEGLLRTLQQVMTGQESGTMKINELRGLKSRKEAKVRIGKNAFSVLAVSGMANMKPILDEIESGNCDYRIIEVMACPGGCINGGGQRLDSDEKSIRSRMKAIYDVDEEEIIKVAYKNPVIQELYERHLAKPCSSRNMELLHNQKVKKESDESLLS